MKCKTRREMVRRDAQLAIFCAHVERFVIVSKPPSPCVRAPIASMRLAAAAAKRSFME